MSLNESKFNPAETPNWAWAGAADSARNVMANRRAFVVRIDEEYMREVG
jgi:hypothetical protein